MLNYYEQALKLFRIESGFVDEQIEEIYKQLLTNSTPNEKLRKDKIRRAYKWLQEPFRHYIISCTSSDIKQEQLEDEILKLIYDYKKNNHYIDDYFIAHLVELLVSARDLHQYLKDIAFKKTKKNSIAGYEQDGILTVYSNSVLDYIKVPNDLDGLSSEDYPYCRVISLFGHEVEHANQKREKEQNCIPIKTKIWKACDCFRDQYNLEFQQIIDMPNPIFWFLNFKLNMFYNGNQRKYMKYWNYSPKERVADLTGYNLALTIIDKSKEKEELEALRNIFISDFTRILFFGYDNQIGPTEYYLEQFEMQERYKNISEIVQRLSLEERLLLGLTISNEELEQATNEEKIIEKVRKLC